MLGGGILGKAKNLQDTKDHDALINRLESIAHALWWQYEYINFFFCGYFEPLWKIIICDKSYLSEQDFP